MSTLVLDADSLAALARRHGAEASLAAGALRLRVGGVDLEATRIDLAGTLRVAGCAFTIEHVRCDAGAVTVDFAVAPS